MLPVPNDSQCSIPTYLLALALAHAHAHAHYPLLFTRDSLRAKVLRSRINQVISTVSLFQAKRIVLVLRYSIIVIALFLYVGQIYITQIKYTLISFTCLKSRTCTRDGSRPYCPHPAPVVSHLSRPYRVAGSPTTHQRTSPCKQHHTPTTAPNSSRIQCDTVAAQTARRHYSPQCRRSCQNPLAWQTR